jgi:acetyl esterase/lipase
VKFLAAIVAAVALVNVATAADQSPSAPDAAALKRAMRPIVYRVPEMDSVVVHSNLKYTNVDDPLVRMDVYTPPASSANERRPFVLLIHGGVPPGVPVKDMGAYRSWGRLIAAHGMVAVTFTHRLRWPPSQIEDAESDVRAAIDFARANAAKFNADGERMCVAAWSAGGPLLSVALQNERKYLRCALAIYPLVDLQGTAGKDMDRLALATYARTPSFVPFFLARAGLDSFPTLNERLDRFVATGLAANAPLTVVNHPTGVHGFDVENDDERSREIIRAALEFMRTHLSVPASR